MSPHGTRARYQTDRCRCVLCRAAEASYRAQLRRLHLHGKQPLGTIISPAEAMKRIRQLKAERFSGRAVTRHFGLKNHSFVVHPNGMRLRRLLKIRRLYRLTMLENRDHGGETASAP